MPVGIDPGFLQHGGLVGVDDPALQFGKSPLGVGDVPAVPVGLLADPLGLLRRPARVGENLLRRLTRVLEDPLGLLGGFGGFKARSLAGSGFGGYKRLIAGGDLDGDGKNDLLAIDASNELWRFRGTGAGTFTSRSLVFKDWGTSYKDVVGGLDLSGDGRADLISLDKDGRAWLNRGNGHGGFDNRSQAGKSTNWSAIRIS
ncbi:FG-GAP repeat domain-containing protein [Streptomyces sp. NPDC047990]|uniref:FG-GAP repeat domain-containing protein n=1 Tax=Streptomyces sp. NPDC047990 TaxID=3365496 RepID=UPI0037247478